MSMAYFFKNLHLKPLSLVLVRIKYTKLRFIPLNYEKKNYKEGITKEQQSIKNIILSNK